MANQKHTSQKTRKTKGGGPLMLAAVVLCAAAVVTLLPRGGGSGAGRETQAETDGGEVQVIAQGESLVIPISDLSSTASFYPVEVDGTQMEVLAVLDSEGGIRTAFNTCQICYSSGRGYYVQDGDALVCQNCRNRFTVNQVEIETGGCNPWPIFAENKTVTDETIEISYDFLQETRAIFANWRSR